MRLRFLSLTAVLAWSPTSVGAQDARDDGPIFVAIRSGETVAVERALREGASVEAPNGGGYRPVHVATMLGQVEALRVLLVRGADVDARTVPGRDRPGPTVISEWIDGPVALPRLVHDEFSALHLAVATNRLECAWVLLEGGADAAAMTREGSLPLHLAFRRPDADRHRFRALAEVGLATFERLPVDDPDAGGWIAFDEGPEASKAGLFALLLEHGSPLSGKRADGLTPLCLAIAARRHDEAGDLLERGASADPAVKDAPGPLHWALESTAPAPFVIKLLEAGADANRLARGDSPLTIAVRRRSVESVRALVASGADPTRHPERKPPLHRAVWDLRADLVAALVESPVRDRIVDTLDHEKRTALHVAVLRKNDEIVRLLCRSGADPNIRNVWGKTPLDEAFWGGHDRIIEDLVDAGARLSAGSDDEWAGHVRRAARSDRPAALAALVRMGCEFDATAMLQAALQAKARRVVEPLLVLGADPNAKDADGNNAFALAINKHNSKALRQLLAHAGESMDFSYRDREGVGLLQLAAEVGNTDVLAALLEFGADPDTDGVAHAAAREGHVRILRELDARGADLNRPTISEVMRKQLRELRKLKEQGVEVDLERVRRLAHRSGDRPIHEAIRHRQPAVVEFLLGIGAEVDDRCLELAGSDERILDLIGR